MNYNIKSSPAEADGAPITPSPLLSNTVRTPTAKDCLLRLSGLEYFQVLRNPNCLLSNTYRFTEVQSEPTSCSRSPNPMFDQTNIMVYKKSLFLSALARVLAMRLTIGPVTLQPHLPPFASVLATSRHCPDLRSVIIIQDRY